MGINWKHRKVIVSIVMCVLLCVTAITAMMYTAFGAGSSNIKNVNAIQVYSNDKAGSADTSEGTDTTGNMDKAGSTDTTGNADTPGVSKLAASDNVLEGYCTFYDYVVAPYKGNVYGWGYKEYPKRSINTSSNYADNGKPKLTVGTIDQNFRANQHNCYVNGLNVNTCIYYNGGIKTTGSFSGVKKDYMNASQGIIYGLDKENYKNVLFNVDEPGLFSDAKKTGKTIYNNYKLTFDKQDNGNDSSTYTLKSVTSPSGDVTLAGDNFFPLNNADSNVLDCGYNAADGQKGTNYYFGMRYDISFSLNGYTGDLLYKFTGDDDLWVFVDGELVLDLGGIHPECGGDVDLWQTGPIARELQTVASRDKVNMSTNHTITVLYMERGGNASNCNMKFIVPNSARIDIADSGNLNFKKIDDRGNGLANAVFGITSKDNKENALTKTSVSDKNGIVSFDNLPVGKYILKEITAPDGYTGSGEEYNVEVVLDENDSSTAIATLTDNSGNVIAVTRTKVQYIDGKKSYAVENVFNSSIVNTRNVSIEDFIVDKQVRVEDWDNRTYKINLMTGISNNNGSYAEGDVINNVIIRDYIDSRFDIIADNNEIVTADKAADQPYSVNGGNIKYDKERNLLYVEWDNQSVQYSDSKLYTWEKSIFVKAKDNYIEGSIMVNKDLKKNSKIRTVNMMIQSALIIILIVLVANMMVEIKNLQGTARVINYAGLVRGATQRVVKLEVIGNSDDELIEYLDDVLADLKYEDGEYNLVSLRDTDYQKKLDIQIDYWGKLKNEINNVRENGVDNSDIVDMSEMYFSLADQTVSAAERYSEGIADNIHFIETITVIDMAGLLLLIIIQMIQAIIIVRKNKVLEQKAYLDAHTGLPNKSRCEEVFHDLRFLDRNVACIMFDLNNLKIANDTLGHSVGDQLIVNFANILRNVIPSKEFVGRYGGDEFVAVIRDMPKEDVIGVLEKLKEKVEDFNDHGKNIKISYAYGWAFSDDYTECTLRTLFDRADKHMYENKRLVKLAQQ